MGDLSEKQAAMNGLRSQRSDAHLAAKAAYAEVKQLESTIAQLASTGSSREQLSQLTEELNRKKSIHEEKTKAFADVKSSLLGSLKEQFNLLPEKLITSMSDTIPFLLFPVRIETKFMKNNNGSDELCVRVYPDDVAVTSHEKELTQSEITGGQTYWTTIWDGRNANGDERERIRAGAWNVLAMRHGPTRAAWIRTATKPDNWNDDLTIASLVFPNLTGKISTWSDAPRSTVMPDRFAFIRYFKGGQLPIIYGSHIPDQLVMGPDPSSATPHISRKDGRLEVHSDIQWMINFDKAVENGMGVRIPITAQEASDGYDRLLVVGIRFSSSAADNRLLLEELIENHHYSSGFSLVPQGTPTNNTENVPSGFSGLDTANEKSFAVEAGKALFEITSDRVAKKDGQRFAEAFNISPDKMFFIANSEKQDVSEAMAMNSALWYATMGAFMSDMLGPVFSDPVIENTRVFFIENVTGRGPFPAFRVGNQPYGVYPTTAFSKWKWARSEGDLAFLDKLKQVLDQLHRRWRSLLDTALTERNEWTDFDRLIDVIGLQASSVEYYSRMATLDKLTKNYYHFMGGLRFDVFNAFLTSKDDNYVSMGLNLVHDPEKVNLKDLTFEKNPVLPPLTRPVVDKEPETPLSETALLSFNYIKWMFENASHAQVLAQDIKGPDGNQVPVPTALLYQTLRHAYLTKVKESSHFAVKAQVAALANVSFSETGIFNIDKNTSRIAIDELNDVDASRIGLGNERKPIADFLLRAVKLKDSTIGPVYPIQLEAFKDALAMLAEMPTARLERAFAEHMDLCSYRLDAWLTGMVNHRLTYLRSIRETRIAHIGEGNAHQPEEADGIYIGAYGWIENLKPSAGEQKIVETEELQAAFGDKVSGVVTEDSSNAGYTLAPSLSQAVTAAILRNAYLTHGDEADSGMMSVNVSSERVRNALYYMEGLRNGQDLGALLGYQLERGLHEKHPGIELDEFIYVLRKRFPLISGKLTKIEDPTATAEVIEARNVVNGHDLLGWIRNKTYPYGLAGLPPLPSSESLDPVNFKRANAIITEMNRLEDSLDAIGDVSLAEGVYQVVGGNYERATGILQAITEGKNPPEIQVTNTPRSGKSITHRVLITFDTSDITGWHSSLTPRAAANPQLNAWLRTILPDPKDVQWMVTADLLANPIISLDDLGLEPLDVVLMVGEKLGNQSSELERFMVHQFRAAHNRPDDHLCFFYKADPDMPQEKTFVFHPDKANAGKIPLTHVMPLLRALKGVIGKGRALTAQDLMQASEGQKLAKTDVKGYYDTGFPELMDLKNMYDRINDRKSGLDAAFNDLNTFYESNIKGLYQAFTNDPTLPLVAGWPGHLDSLRGLLMPFVVYGIPEALPANRENTGDLRLKIASLVAQVLVVIKLVRKKLDDAAKRVTLLALPADVKKHQETIDQKLIDYREAAQLLMGKSFTVLPLFKIYNPAGLSASLTASHTLANELQVEEWVQSCSRVRPPVQQLNNIVTYHDLLHSKGMQLHAVQLPFKAGDKWIGLEFGGDMKIETDVTSLLVNQLPPDVTALQCGLMVDEWTELIPGEKETAGISFHFNRPNAVAPQAVLLAVSPELKGNWAWDDLVSVINETLDLSKLRTVEPDMVMKSEYADVLPTVLTSFSKSRVMLSTFFDHVQLKSK